MPEFDRLNGSTDWIDLGFVERERTPEQIIELGIQLHLAGLSLSNTKQYLEKLGVERSRTAIHDWVQKADLQPASEVTSNHVAVNETVIQVNDQRHWLYAAVDPETNHLLHVRLFHTRRPNLPLAPSASSRTSTTLTASRSSSTTPTTSKRHWIDSATDFR